MTIKQKLYKIIFETDTKAGRTFDIFLLWFILLSVLVVMVESIPTIGQKYARLFLVIEYFFTILFSLEYILRIVVNPRPVKYIFSFWGIIDLLSILPTYISLVIAGYHYLLIVRIFRLLRVFRILKLARFTSESKVLAEALRASSYKISVFFMAIIAIVTFMGTLMYVIEGGERGFTSIPQSIYWAIVTLTTVGYGDIVPQTVLGKIMSSLAMIIGYAIIAVPTGIVTAELSKPSTTNSLSCNHCNTSNDLDARYCKRCGQLLIG